MATDFLFYDLTRPSGLFLIGAGILGAFLFWRFLLGDRYREIGMLPLALAYFCGLAGLAINNFWGAYDKFSARVLEGSLLETQRWSIVPGWTLHTLVLSLVVVVPAVALIAVPFAASLVKSDRLNYRNIGKGVLAAWIGFAILMWVFVSGVNRAVQPEFLLEILLETLPAILLIAGPFLLALYLASRRSSPAKA